MPEVSSSRPSRRNVRRPIVEEDDSENELGDTTVRPRDPDENEQDFTPAPTSLKRKGRPPRKSIARTVGDASTATTASAAAPRPRGRPKKSEAPKPSVEPSGGFDPDVTSATIATDVGAEEEETPAKRTVVRKRKVAPTKNKVVAKQSSQEIVPPIKPSPSQQDDEVIPSAPLADITYGNINTNHIPRPSEDGAQATVKPIRPLDTVLERPMDIVLKARTMGPPPVVEETGPRPRIVITYLVLTNFKSYAGRQEVGPFHASFSSVVGPNGSGKSNVIDSLLFVFGFRASKMRQGKISALIHNSAAYPDLDYCEVAVQFQEVLDQPGGAPRVIPDTGLTLSRRAFKNNSSKYYLNGKESNFTMVTSLLREKGVDLDHKRFLILQGEVESIAQMKPKAASEHDDGLLEYLEDIIGTSKYKTPIEESATEVETLNEVCMEKSGRVQHVERERNSLEDKKNKAVAYLNDENELTTKRSALWQIWMSEYQDNISVTTEAIEQMQQQLNAELEKHYGGEQVIKQMEKEYARGSKILEAKEKETQALVKDVAKFEQERVKFDEKKKFLLDKRRKLEKSIANAETAKVEADETIDQCTEEIATRAQEMASLEKQVKEDEAELVDIRDGLKGKTQAFSEQIAARQKALEPWTEKINQKQSAIAVAESETKILEEKANAGTVALGEMETKIVAINDGKTAKIKELKQCQTEKAKLEQEATDVEKELGQLAEQEPKARAKVSNARQKADEARSSLSKTQTQGNVLSALMRMKESGRIDGFHGRLGNLGTINEQYDVAISTACGALDNFVTDTVEAGQQCVEYLRKTNLGRGNFMCLDKLRARDMVPIKTPENAPRLFDLVKAKDEKFRPAFYHALQDTIVATDLAQANRIAYGAKRWRVVTLDGELIDKSGTMAGGGTTVKRGLMSSKLVSDVSKEQVTKLENDRDVIEERFQEFQDHIRNLESRHRDLKDQIPQLDTKMQKIGLEIESATRNLADVHKRIKELSREHQPSASDDSRISFLRKEIAKLNKEVAKLHSETASIEDEIKVLQDKIMEIGGEKLRAQRSKIDGLKHEIASHNEETSNAEVRKAKAEKQKVKLEKDHSKATKEVQAAASGLEKLGDEIQNQGEKADMLNEKVAKAEEVLSEMKTELKTLKTELDEKTSELNQTKAIEIEMRNKLEENQKILSEAQRQLNFREQKLSALQLTNIDDITGAVASRPARAHPSVEENTSANVTKIEDEDVEMGEADQEQAFAGNEGNDSSHRLELPKYTPDELADMSKDRLKAEIAILEERTANVSVDLSVLAEYRRRVEEHAARSSDLASAVTQRDAAKRRCDDLRRLRLEGFMEGFSAISLRLKEMYQMITMGGNAELELVDSLDPFSEGILFSVMPPKKSWKNISNLSGGEKTLSSLALVFALHHYKPTPLYVMDEIDAALDFRNVSIVANYIKERTKNAQFIVISLRNNMFELAARLVGVYKVNHMTKSVTIENQDFIHRAPGGSQAGSTTGSTPLPMR